jgi:PEP-CTERM motif
MQKEFRMRRPLYLTAVLALLLKPTTADATPLADFSVFSTGDNSCFPSCIFGWDFSAASPFTVDALGIWDQNPDGLLASHEIGLWTSTGTLLASATITNANSSATASGVPAPGRWLFTPIAPLTLAAGTYVLGSTFQCCLDPIVFPLGTETILPGFTFGGPRVGFGSALMFPDPFQTPAVGSHPFLGPNLDLAPIPEPATLTLLGLGLFGARVAIRRRKANLI